QLAFFRVIPWLPWPSFFKTSAQVSAILAKMMFVRMMRTDRTHREAPRVRTPSPPCRGLHPAEPAAALSGPADERCELSVGDPGPGASRCHGDLPARSG